MRIGVMPTKRELEKHARLIPEINPSAVLAMLGIMRAADNIQHQILDVLEAEYHLSEGKLIVMILLHQAQQPLAPSIIAQRVGVTKATISLMLRRMQRDGLVTMTDSPEDKRFKLVALTEAGQTLLAEALPTHYWRISNLMSRLDETERATLHELLQKLVVSEVETSPVR